MYVTGNIFSFQLEYLAHNANYMRRKQRPEEPKELHFDLQDEHLPKNFLVRDIRVGPARHILLATDSQLATLALAKT